MKAKMAAVALGIALGCNVPGARAGQPLFKLAENPVTCPADWEKCDINAPMARDSQGALWLIICQGGTFKDCPWRVFKGTSVDAMVRQHDTDPTLTSFPRPHQDDTYWSAGLWIDPQDGKWLCPAHIEFNYRKFGSHSLSLQRRIGLTTSTDRGKTWQYLGDILTSDNSCNPDDYKDRQYFDQGCGDPELYYDTRYFYLFFMDAWVSKSTWKRYFAVRTARCARADLMAPGKWKKWYRGAWTEPGLGGRCSDVFNSGGSESANVFYSTHLKKYCALIGGGNGGTDRDPDLFMATCTDLDRQNWTSPVKIASAGQNSWYHWAVDKTSFSRMQMDGTSFRYYTAGYSVPKWFDVTILESENAGTTPPPVYPPDPVDDYNPGWDPVHCPGK